MEIFCVCISLCKPRNSRFYFLKVLFTEEERVVFIEKIRFKLIEETTVRVVGKLLDPVESS